jgi:SAM-dependent methyltransferase
MIESRPWNWENVEEAHWLQPATEIRALLERWKKADYSRLLDVGCGLGRHALLFARAGFSVTGFDLSKSALARLIELAAMERLEVLTCLGDLRKLPFDDGAFDCILAYRSIYHNDFQGLMEAVGEARRVLSPGGEMFANFISKESDYYLEGTGATLDPRVRLKEEEGGAVLPHCYLDETELRRLLAAFDIRSLSLDAEPETPGPSRYYRVLAG